MTLESLATLFGNEIPPKDAHLYLMTKNCDPWPPLAAKWLRIGVLGSQTTQRRMPGEKGLKWVLVEVCLTGFLVILCKFIFSGILWTYGEQRICFHIWIAHTNGQVTTIALITISKTLWLLKSMLLVVGFFFFFNFNLEITTMQELVTLVSLKMMESIDFSLVSHFLISTLENYLEVFLLHRSREDNWR